MLLFFNSILILLLFMKCGQIWSVYSKDCLKVLSGHQKAIGASRGVACVSCACAVCVFLSDHCFSRSRVHQCRRCLHCERLGRLHGEALVPPIFPIASVHDDRCSRTARTARTAHAHTQGHEHGPAHANVAGTHRGHHASRHPRRRPHPRLRRRRWSLSLSLLSL